MELVLEEGAKYKIRSWRSMANEFGVYDDCIDMPRCFTSKMDYLCGCYTPPVLYAYNEYSYGEIRNANHSVDRDTWLISLKMIDWTAEVLY